MCGSCVHTKHGSAGGLESFHSGDRIQKAADSGTQPAGLVWTEGRSDNISFRIQAIKVLFCFEAMRKQIKDILVLTMESMDVKFMMSVHSTVWEGDIFSLVFVGCVII